jgi:hypothetical protein
MDPVSVPHDLRYVISPLRTATRLTYLSLLHAATSFLYPLRWMATITQIGTLRTLIPMINRSGKEKATFPVKVNIKHTWLIFPLQRRCGMLLSLVAFDY